MKGTFSNSKRGFTLVELVVVIAIIAILSGVGFAAYTGYVEYAQKGVDRETVGEIMHAIELADYGDPDMIPDGGTATVYLTSNGVSAFIGSDVEKSAEFNSALKNAFGELDSVTLRYDEWEGAMEAGALSGLLKSISEYNASNDASAMNQYLSGSKTASFAGDIEQYWERVQDYIDLFSSAYGEGGNDPDKDYLLSAVVNESIDPDTMQKYVEFFGQGGDDVGMNHASKSFRAAAVASNYAFAAWVKENHSGDIKGDEMEEQYRNLTTVGRNVQNFANTLKDEEDWEPLIKEYYETQGATDMLAYFGMLESAKTLEPEGGRLKDTEYVPQAGKVVSSAAGVLSRSVSIEQLRELADNLQNAGGSSIVSVTAKKTNGQLVWDDRSVTPKEANPRTGNGGGVSACDKTHTETLSVKLEGSKIEPEGNIELCSVENHSCTVSFTATASNPNYLNTVLKRIEVSGTEGINIDQSSLKTTGQFTVTATKSGTITIKINTISKHINVIVH